jgi:hypothetical protein
MIKKKVEAGVSKNCHYEQPPDYPQGGNNRFPLYKSLVQV